jgi:hypothetical protein
MEQKLQEKQVKSMSTAKPNPDKKFGKELNTDKLSFQPDDYFMK